MVKILIVLLMLVTASQANRFSDDALYKELQTLNSEQKEILKTTWERGKPLGLNYTLTAIAWQESNFGKYKVGKWSPDYGVFQINLKTYKSRYKDEIKVYKLQDRHIKKWLTDNYTIGFIAAVDEILFWKEVHDGNWNKIWASYNDGTRIGYKGKKYSKEISQRIRVIDRYYKGGFLR